MTTLNEILQVVLIGAGATLVMDIWLLALKRMGVQTLNFALIGRWVGHLFYGRVAHSAIGKSWPIPHEAALGWLTHYAVGIGFAALLLALAGGAWAAQPALLPALLLGMGTVLFPLLVMQPAMGLGFAASKTPAPLKSCGRSLLNHTVFGLGLYLSASLLVLFWANRPLTQIPISLFRSQT